jgi:cytochrome oxidase Cu insertion factor (SCO1/SenC/PrrC family)
VRRDRLIIAVALVSLPIAVSLAVAVLVASRRSDNGPPASGPRAGPYRGSEPPGRNELAPFALASYRGDRISSARLRGKVVALTFLESKCTEACPIIAVQVARGIDLLTPSKRRQVRAIAISTQPFDDTRQNVRRFLARRHAIGRLDYLIGTEAELRPVWRRYHILSDILAANQLGRALFSELYAVPARPVNNARFVFLDPRAETFYGDWERVAGECVAILRWAAGRDPHDRDFSEAVRLHAPASRQLERGTLRS